MEKKEEELKRTEEEVERVRKERLDNCLPNPGLNHIFVLCNILSRC